MTCRIDGMRQPQVDFMANVPSVTPAATMAPDTGVSIQCEQL